MPIETEVALSVAANAISTNRMSGRLYEVPAQPSMIRLYVTASAVGLRATLLVGGVPVANDTEVSGVNRYPLRPDDLFTEIGAYAGERLFLTFRNTTGAAITVTWFADISPV